MRYGIHLCSKYVTSSSPVSMTKDYVLSCLTKIVQLDYKYGFSGDNFADFVPKKIVVEYSSPNIAKKFHAGHLRSTIVGQAISNILEAPGNKVTRVNYLGDWGMQFAILSIGFQKFGSKKAMLDDPIKHLNDIYVRANADIGLDCMREKAEELFSKMEDGDADSLKFWEWCRDISLREFHKLYKNINIEFDHYEFESMYCSKAKELVSNLKNQGMLLTLPSGSEGLDISNTSWCQRHTGADPITVKLVRKNRTTIYLSRDVAAAIHRQKKYSFDKMIYITDKAQNGHFIQVFAALEHIGFDWAKQDNDILKHIGFGRVIGMSTRGGESVFLDDIFNDAYEKTKLDRQEHSTRKTDIEDQENAIQNLALAGLICSDLKARIAKDYRFSWSRALDSKGDTGLFLQYSHSRLQSLKRNCGVDFTLHVDCACLLNDPHAMNLFEHLLKLNDVCWSAYSQLEPSYLVKYMFQLSHLIAKAHRHLKVKDIDISVAQPRLLLFQCAQIALRNCMKTIGIKPLDKM